MNVSLGLAFALEDKLIPNPTPKVLRKKSRRLPIIPLKLKNYSYRSCLCSGLFKKREKRILGLRYEGAWRSGRLSELEEDSKGNLDECATRKADGVCFELGKREPDSVFARQDRVLDSRAAAHGAGIC